MALHPRPRPDYIAQSAVYPLRLYTGIEVRRLLRLSTATYRALLERNILQGTGPIRLLDRGRLSVNRCRAYYTPLDIIRAIDYLYPRMHPRNRRYIVGQLGARREAGREAGRPNNPPNPTITHTDTGGVSTVDPPVVDGDGGDPPATG